MADDGGRIDPTSGDAGLAALANLLSPQAPVSADVARTIRKDIFADAIVSRVEANLLFDLNRRVETPDSEWFSLFREAISDFLLHQEAPVGVVTDEEADWLIARIGDDGRVCLATEAELLLHILERAERAPERLAHFALTACVDAAMTAGRVGEEDVKRLRRAVYALGSRGATFVDADEAEALFDLADATAGGDNHPDWADFFAKAIANYVMSFARPATAEDALALAGYAGLPDASGKGFFERATGGGLKGWWSAVRTPDQHTLLKAAHVAKEEALAEAEVVTGDESAWLWARIRRDGVKSDAERALVAFLDRENPGWRG